MSTEKHPWMKFYPQDWRGDAKLRRCSRAARSLWLDMLGLMHEATPYGHLVMDGKPLEATDLARIFGDHWRSVQAFLKELSDAGVYSVTPSGIVFSRRMVRDEETRQRRANGGVRSLENPNVPRPKEPAKDILADVHKGPTQIPEARSQSTRKKKSVTDAHASEPDRPSNLDVLPKEFVDAAYARWVADLGSCSYPHLRKALLPVYQAPNAPHPSAEELSEAIGAFLDGRDADSPAWRQKWTVQKFAAELPDWVRLGRMQYVDEWGIPTERGIVAKLFGASA